MGLTTRRALGVALLAGTYVPVHRLLDPTRAGPAGAATRASAEAAWSAGLYGSVVVAGVALVLALLVPTERLRASLGAAGRLLGRPSAGAFAAAAGLLAAGLSSVVALALFGGLPTSVDEMAQLLHARALTGGVLALPLAGDESAWVVQNGLVTPEGWAAIYPPLHTIALAAGLWIGAPWLVGPAMVGVATWASALAFERLLGPGPGRAAGALLAVTPFWLLLGGTHLSHSTAAACLAVALIAALRARDGRLGWAVVTGAAVGAAVCSRPWIGMASSAALLLATWWPRDRPSPGVGAVVGRLVATGVGGFPFAALIFWWNSRLFGHPLRLGYAATFGPTHGLGFHVDPWGNAYGVREALAYTGADLVQLGAHLFQTPLPALAVVGLALLVHTRIAGSGVLLAWCLAAVAANALYWHHGLHMGPRMLYESVPAWVGLFVVSACLFVSEPVDAASRGTAPWVVGVALLGAIALGPAAFRAAAPGASARVAATLPDVPDSESVLVFVHGSWSSRVASRLAAAGMRRDSIETALRRNDICAVERYARWRSSDASGRASQPPPLDLRAQPGTPATLEVLRLSPGNLVRVAPSWRQDGVCLREARADRLGSLELEPLLWQAPPLAGRHLVVARDQGPETNAVVRDALGRTAYVFIAGREPEPPRVLEYEAGMELLWGPSGRP